MPAPRTRRFHPVLLLVIIVILAAIGQVVLGVFMPLLWIAFLGAAVLFASRHLRRPARARTARQPPTPGET
jgi:heme A synthase